MLQLPISEHSYIKYTILYIYIRGFITNHPIPIGSFGWKSMSFTDPLCPGNLYNILRLVVSQI